MPVMHTILHLTDIHFGWEGDNSSGQAERKVCLDSLLQEVKRQTKPWKPNVICISGDVGWQGSESDYAAAKKWLDKLLSVCGLTYTELVVCVGNHDVVRSKAEKLPRPESTTDADNVLKPPIANHFEEPFSNFTSFCKKAGIPNLEFGSEASHLIGSRMIQDFRFVSLNSAWFSKDDDDKGKLRIGLPLLKYLEASDQLPLLEPGQGALTVALVHHPAEWLHSDEQHASSSRPNPIDYVAHRCHVLLTGHTHGEVRGADRIADRALHFTGGSAYAGASHFNSFRLIQIGADEVVDLAFEFDPRSSENLWRPYPAKSRPLTYEKETKKGSVKPKEHFTTEHFRASFRRDAVRHLERKSRLYDKLVLFHRRCHDLSPCVSVFSTMNMILLGDW
jgi:predicted MPP superfamily phosphohydrolase